MLARFPKLTARLRHLWELVKHEHATPREIGWAVALGVFIGCTPALGLHGWIALGTATLLRLNRLWAFLGSRVCSFVFLPWITLAELEVAHRVRTGGWLLLRASTVLHEAHGLLADWLLGTAIVGGALALAVGLFAYALARRVHSVATLPEADIAPSLDHAPRVIGRHG